MKNVNLENWSFIVGMKTEDGIERVVPIHPKIQPLVLKKYKEAEELGREYLINCIEAGMYRNDLKLTYDKYLRRFIKIRDKLQLNPLHRPHDPRKHFVTMAKKYNVDEYAIKYLVGHSISDITEKVYTKRELNWLQDEIEKIK